MSDLLLRISTEHGPLYDALKAQSGQKTTRVFGTGALRGSDSSLYVVVRHDEHLLNRMTRSDSLWGNWIVITVRRTRINGVPVARWAEQVLTDLCQQMEVWHGHAELEEQYDFKNMQLTDGMRAVGLDVTKSLPGIYWLNFFGRPYRDLIGEERLLSAPAAKVNKLDNGVMLMVHPDPAAWTTAEYSTQERAVLEHIGTKFFFDKAREYQGTIAPDFSTLR